MKNLWFAPAALGMLLAAPALAERPASVIAPRSVSAASLVSAESAEPPATQTPDRWKYPQHQSRNTDPAAAVRRNAEFRALQRRYRIAASKWYGYSNSRPVSSPTPWWGTYRSAWVSGTSPRRYAWSGTRWPY